MDSYVQLRAALQQYQARGKVFDRGGHSHEDTSAPMEVDAFTKGK